MGPPVGWAVALWVVAAVCVGGALLLGVLAATGFWIDHQMDTNGVTTTATVTDVDDDWVTVNFTTEDGRRVTSEFTWWPAEDPAVDDQIEITYDPDDPAYVIKAGSDEDQLLATIIAVAAVFALAVAVGTGVGAVIVHRARGKAARSNTVY